VKTLLAGFLAAGLAAATVHTQSGTWKVPRTPDGHPDLQGVWSNNSVTPMTRPPQWKDKERLTDAEVEELKQIVARYTDQGGDAIFGSLVQLALQAKEKGQFNQTSYDRTTGNYNQFWMADRDWDNRTSLITDPKNGQPRGQPFDDRHPRRRAGRRGQGSRDCFKNRVAVKGL
jgi:hypothetical protein